ncbi:3-phosphoglycerate dehydrogenase [Candidatus Saccharibacteria bacterium]|nr:MAG: 3-phosphoglycerate dehydrogenase [Candidatus Saccharibacteria bacterium]PID99076.1 MAG: 3-phosphoglycerate dehydrogenase [Candidatus Saccharibacteria bacterium]
MKILLATQKPFSKEAVGAIRKLSEDAGHELAVLEGYKEQADFVQSVQDVEALIVRSDNVDSTVVDAAPKLKIVVRAGAGYDNVDLTACSKAGVVVMNTPGQNSNAVAELAIGLMIYSARNFFSPGTGTELCGRSLGLQAYGNVGKLVASHAKGLGMKVYAYDPYVNRETMQAAGVEPTETLEALYRTSDYLSLHIPALPDTIASVGYDLLSLLPHGATLLNTARKEIIDETGLRQALTDRPDLSYVSDVMPDNYQELLAAFPGRVYATPKKMGAETAEANENAGRAAIQQIAKFFASGDTTFQVNK